MKEIHELREKAAQARRLIMVLGDESAAIQLKMFAAECDRRATELENRDIFQPFDRLIKQVEDR